MYTCTENRDICTPATGHRDMCTSCTGNTDMFVHVQDK